MFQGLRTTVYHVADLAAAKAWYTERLGQAPYFDQPFYVGFNVGGYEFGLSPLDNPTGAPEAITYWGVPNADDAQAELIAQGATEYHPVTDVGDGVRVGAVKDPFGNVVGVIENPYFTLG